MPVIRKGKKIVEKKTGKVVGKSDSVAMAKKAVAARNMAHAGKLTKQQKR
jgi:hypothetical protein